jgi:hypothetical protein
VRWALFALLLLAFIAVVEIADARTRHVRRLDLLAAALLGALAFAAAFFALLLEDVT